MTSVARTFEERELIEMLLQGVNRSGRATAVGLQDDGSLRAWSMLVGRDSSDVERLTLLEDNGSPRVVNYGKVSGTITAFELENGGLLKNTLYGKDSAGNIDPLRTNVNQQLIVEPYENWIRVTPVELTNADAVVLDGSSLYSTGDQVLVEMFLYNFSAVAATVTVYVDVSAGGTAGNNEYIMNAENLGSKSRVVLPMIQMLGQDDIRAFTSAGNDVNIHFRTRIVRTV